MSSHSHITATHEADGAESPQSLNEAKLEKNDGIRSRTNDAKLEKQYSHNDGITDVNQLLANPLKFFTRDEVARRGRAFAEEGGMPEMSDAFFKGALVAQHPTLFEDMPELTEEDKEVFRRETTHKWRYPRRLYYLVITCSLAAAVQGIDQSVISGANLFWSLPDQLNVSNPWQRGIVNAIPYFSCALVASWFTDPMNRYLGRRGTIFLTCAIACLTCIWSALVGSWWELLLARFFLGFGIGPKSATVPVYAAECTPPLIRGGLVMQWQLWTAFGIMLGYVADIAFYRVADPPGINGLNWRLMLGAACIPPIAVMLLVFFSPESPRWYLSKKRYKDAFQSFRLLRNSDVQAARDCFLAHELIQAEAEVHRSGRTRNRLVEMFTVARNRKGVFAATIVMFGQQFCGVNVIAYYGGEVFRAANASDIASLAASLGWGALNTLAAIPAIFTIDTFGRRSLLLVGFPLMGAFLLFTGLSFLIPNDTARIACVALGTYLHCAAYSPTAGPVPFTYSAEAFPLHIRDAGMSYAVSVTWFFNGVLSLTFPALMSEWGSTGAFCWYAAWNIALWIITYFFLPETKALTLEELDAVFSVSNKTHAQYHLRKLPYFARKLLLCHRGEVYDGEPLYAHEKLSREERAMRGTMMPVAAGH